VAARVQRENPDWPDEEVFQRARRFVIATLQVPRLSKHHQNLKFNQKLFREPKKKLTLKILSVKFYFKFDQVILGLKF